MDGEGGTGRGMNEANKGESAGTVTEQGGQRDGAAGNREAETQGPWERGVSGGLGTGLLEAGRGRGPEVWESGAGVTPVTFRGLPGTSGETPTVREMQTKTQTGPRPLCLVWVPTVSVGGPAREEACLPPGLWGDSNWGDHGGEACRALIGHPGTRGLEGRGPAWTAPFGSGRARVTAGVGPRGARKCLGREGWCPLWQLARPYLAGPTVRVSSRIPGREKVDLALLWAHLPRGQVTGAREAAGAQK